MLVKPLISKSFARIVLLGMVLFLLLSFLRGTFLVKQSEKELNPKKQVEEAQAKTYSLKEIDAMTGQVRWQLSAKEGKTEENLHAALVKDVKAEVYKNNQIIFELESPFARVKESTREIYLFGKVVAKNKEGNFLLESNQLSLGMGLSIEAQKGFNLTLKNNGVVTGENALINDDQTKITVTNLTNALFNDLSLMGSLVSIERDKNGEALSVLISNGGDIFLTKRNAKLSANSIKWDKTGVVEGKDNVSYLSADNNFMAGYLLLAKDGKVTASKSVKISRGSTSCYGDNLKYDNASLITLTGRAGALQGSKNITADKIIYNKETDKVEANGNVRIIVKEQ